MTPAGDLGSVRGIQPPAGAQDAVTNLEDASAFHADASVQPRGEAGAPTKKRRQLCRFYGTKKGCRAGDACPFRHDASRLKHPQSAVDGGESSLVRASESTGTSARDDQSDATRRDAVSHVVQTDKAIARPTPQAEMENPRAFQIGQIKKRFGAREVPKQDGAATLQFGMPPSDPDFPFDIKALECTITVPVDFPHEAAPSLRISNGEMERGYQINVERGFEAIWRDLRQRSLLNAVKLLDRRLESLLTAQKAETITIVANSRPAPSSSSSKQGPSIHDSGVGSVPSKPNSQLGFNTLKGRPSLARIDEARARREAETRQLTQRLGRDPRFKSEANGTIFAIPIEPREPNELPLELRGLKQVRLTVPEEYDIEHPGIQLSDAEGETCENVERGFAQRTRDHPELTLLNHVNYLAQNIHSMAVQKFEVDTIEPTLPHASESASAIPSISDLTAEAKDGIILDTDKDHIKIVPRPPEWDESSDDENEEEGDDDLDRDDALLSYSDSGSGEAQEQKSARHDNPVPSGSHRESGVLLSFPKLELYNIELLELTSISVTVKCTRCKEHMDVSGIKPNSSNDPDSASSSKQSGRTITCKKCNLSLYVAYRPDLIHAASQRAGYLDVEGCDPADLLPSTFLPTCATCSTTHSPPGVVSVRGASDSLAICRGCHGRMLFKIPDVRFLRVGAAATNLPLRVNRPKQREQLGIVAGSELPSRGACKHYAKSYRWFRFGCCQKVYPCDKCHDDAVNAADGDGHPQEFANRMICGFCSREQIYKPRECGYCGKGVTGRKGGGFWEGGKGTRDPKRMSRKDPRKYKLRKKQRQKALGGRAGGAKNA